MEVKVRTILRLAMAIGSYEFTQQLPEGATMDMLLTAVEDRFGPETHPYLREVPSTDQHPGLLFYVNHTLVTDDDPLATVLRDGDVIYLASPAGGG